MKTMDTRNNEPEGLTEEQLTFGTLFSSIHHCQERSLE